MSQQQKGQRPQLAQPRGDAPDPGAWEKMTHAEKLRQLAEFLDSPAFFDKLAVNAPDFIASQDRSLAAYAKQIKHGCMSVAQGQTGPKLLLPRMHSIVGIIQGVVGIARRGLTIGDNIAWLVPYTTDGRPTVQVQLGYMGLYTLAGKAGLVTKVVCQAIYKNDKRQILAGTDGKVYHELYLDGPRGEFIGAYAIVYLPNDEMPLVEYIDKATVDHIRQMSPSRDSPAWKNWYDQMARAKVFKRAMKTVPKPLHWDSSLFDDIDDQGEVIEGTAETVETGAARPRAARLSHNPAEVINVVQPQRQREKAPVEAGYDDDYGDPPADQAGDPGAGGGGQKQPAAADTVDQDGVVHDGGAAGQGGSAPQDEPPQQDGGRRRGGGRGGQQNGNLAFAED